MFQVFDNGKPADSNGFPYLANLGWENSRFYTLEDARDYAHKWLGMGIYGMFEIGVNFPYDYSGYGDTIEIRQIEE